MPTNSPTLPETIHGVDVADFRDGYLDALLFGSTDESTPSGGYPLDDNYGRGDFSPDAMARINAECIAFLEKAGHLVTSENCLAWERLDCSVDAYAGHDFFFTRQGAGVGFWEDDDWAAEAGEALTEAAKSFGECYPYIGDDGQIHV